MKRPRDGWSSGDWEFGDCQPRNGIESHGTDDIHWAKRSSIIYSLLLLLSSPRGVGLPLPISPTTKTSPKAVFFLHSRGWCPSGPHLISPEDVSSASSTCLSTSSSLLPPGGLHLLSRGQTETERCRRQPPGSRRGHPGRSWRGTSDRDRTRCTRRKPQRPGRRRQMLASPCSAPCSSRGSFMSPAYSGQPGG